MVDQWLLVVVVLLELLKHTSAQTTAPAMTAPPTTNGFTPKLGASVPAAGPGASSCDCSAPVAGGLASVAAGADVAPPDAAPPEAAPPLWSCASCIGWAVDAAWAKATSRFELMSAAAATTAIHTRFMVFSPL